MALTDTIYPVVTSAATPGGDVASPSRTYNEGDLVWAIWGAAFDGISNPLTITNDGVPQTWNPVERQTNNDGLNIDLAVWYCEMSVTQSMVISVAGAQGSNMVPWLYVGSENGQHGTTPIPAGNVFKGSNLTDFSQVITPSAPGSSLYAIVGDWNATNTFAPIANCTLEQVSHDSGDGTLALIRPTTQPRPDATAFTLGETDTGGRIAFIVFEVMAAGGVTGPVDIYLWPTTVPAGSDVWLRDPTQAASGGAYAADAADTATATDAADGVGVFLVAAIDAAAAGDSSTQQLVAPAAAADSTTAIDAAGSAAAVSAAAADAVTAGDAATTTAAYLRSAADSVTASDSATAASVVASAASDAAAATDEATTQSTVSSSAADTVSAADSSTTQTTLLRDASDAVTAADSAGETGAFSASASDAGAAADSASVQYTRGAAATDSVAATDASSSTSVAGAAAADSVAPTDTAAATGAIEATSQDATSVSDSAAIDAAGALFATDAVSASDTAVPTLAIEVAASDAAAVTDSASNSLTAFPNASDAVSAGDEASAIVATDLAAEDAFDLDDEADGEGAAGDEAMDAIEASDAAVCELIRSASAADAIEAADAAATQAVIAEAVAQALSLVDVATALVSGTGIDPADLWNFAVEGGYTAADILRMAAAVLAGRSRIVKTGSGAAAVTFDAVDESEARVVASMAGGLRADVDLGVLPPTGAGGTTSDPAEIWGYALEGSFTAAEILRLIAAVLAGKDSVTKMGAGAAHVEYLAIDGSAVRVAADVNGSERQQMALTP